MLHVLMPSPSTRWRAVCAVVALIVGACSSGPQTKDASGQTAAEKVYREAQDELASGAYERAIKAFERVEGLAAGTQLAQQAHPELAYAQWKGGEKASALAAVERFIKLNPSSPGQDYAFYLRGLIHFNDDLGLLGNVLGQRMSERDQRASRDAWQAFKQLVDQYPSSPYAADARLRMNYLVNAMAESEIQVAKYYMRRGAYLAAANRAQQAVAEYPDAPAAEEALALMARAYGLLQLPELRNAAQRVLKLNYPNSSLLAAQDAERPWWRLW